MTCSACRAGRPGTATTSRCCSPGWNRATAMGLSPARTDRLAGMRIFMAGASGVIGIRLVPLLVNAGHVVAGMTRSPGKAGLLREAGADPVVCDVYDAAALTAAVQGFAPDVVFH